MFVKGTTIGWMRMSLAAEAIRKEAFVTALGINVTGQRRLCSFVSR